MRRRLWFTLAGAALAAGLVGPIAAGAAGGGARGVKGLPLRNPNAHAKVSPVGEVTSTSSRTIGASWQGLNAPSAPAPDTDGAIGPTSYIEITNLKIGIYTKPGTLTASANLSTLTGHSQFSLSDPMILWDPDTQRFFYNVWDVGQSTMAWGFSKDDNPTTIPGSFCNYTNSFGYTTNEFPDYP